MSRPGLLLLGLLWFGPGGSTAWALGAELNPAVTLHLHGPLKDVLEKVAREGHINLVVMGNLQDPVDVHFEHIPANEALRSLAKANHLALSQQGNIWTLSREDGAAAGAPLAPSAVVHDDVGQEVENESDDPPDDSDLSHRASDRKMRLAERLARIKLRHAGGADSGDDAVGSGSVTVAEDQTVNDAVAFGGSLDVKGHVQGDAVALGGSVHLGPRAVVDGDVTSIGGSVNAESGARVNGEQTEIGGNQGIVKALGHGMRAQVLPDANDRNHEGHFGLFVSLLLLQFALFFGVGFIFWMFAPARMKQIEGELRRDPVLCLVTGALGMVGVGVLGTLLVVSCLGIPLAVVLGLAAVLSVAMGLSAFASELGQRLPILRGRQRTQAAVLALGIALLLGVEMILVEVVPVLGILAGAAIFSVGLGAIIRTRFGTIPKGLPEPV